jgi:hypothetical protein
MIPKSLGSTAVIRHKFIVINVLLRISMKTTTTILRGLALDVLVIETAHTDAVGMLFYRAEIVLRERKTGARHLVRRSRIPGTGLEMARAMQQQGLRALETFLPNR